MITDDVARLSRQHRCMQSFMRGTRRCIGMHLTSAEMAMVVAAMGRWSMYLYETTAQEVAFCHDYHVICPKLGSQGVRVEVSGHESDMY